ncbi:hypothetical protein [Alicyclobacillus sendaiensis]|uniref:hypothetical protein n=1 Tax=Alicyclobacillus sendaiensis TaxID=192387 RepID=UPI000781E36A|nr:hypothetical protein [Alicyclobacillus sendaiensis]
MHKFYVGQPVIVGPHAEHSVGCQGRIERIRGRMCDVRITTTRGNYLSTFDARTLAPSDSHALHPERALQRALDKLLAEAKAAIAAEEVKTTWS